MSKALAKVNDNKARGVIAGGASAVLPGLGQLINGETDKALGVGVTAFVAGFGIWSAIPVIGTAAWAVGGVAWLYGVADGYFTGKKK
jgi:TM2 domain-containing membrane protein YozV